MGKNPSDTFYWNDWESDTGLRACSLAAQGLWMRMLCIMAKAEPYGYLKIEGEPCTEADLARQVGDSTETVTLLLGELNRRNVFSLSRGGIIKSRKMVERYNLSLKRSISGSKGATVTNGKQKKKRRLARQSVRQPPRQKPGSSILPTSKKTISKETLLPEDFPTTEDKSRAVVWWKANGADVFHVLDVEAMAFTFRETYINQTAKSWRGKWATWTQNQVKYARRDMGDAPRDEPREFDISRLQANPSGPELPEFKPRKQA